MADLLELEVTLFLLIALGLLVRKLGIVGNEGKKNMTDLVLQVVLPCNIVTSFLSGGTDTLRDCISVLLISIGIQLFCLIYGRLVFRRQSEERRINLSYATVCSNAGFLGNPIAEGVFGAIGLMYASVYLIPLRIMMWSEGLSAYTGESDWRATVKKVLTHPCIIACAIGIVLMLTGITLPGFLLTPLQTVGKCNTCLCMLVIGMILAEVDPKSLLDRTVLVFCLHRLVLIPLIIWLVLLPLPVTPLARGLCVLLAAMPAGSTTSMLASKYDRDPAFATTLVVTSTLLSIPAIFVWSIILR